MFNLINKKSDKEKYWSDTIKAWKQSGLSITAYCVQNDLNNTTFHKWKSKLSLKENKSDKITVAKIAVKENPIAFDNKGIELWLKNEYRIRIKDDFSSETLLKLIKVLKAI